jgi:hypothetical protein
LKQQAKEKEEKVWDGHSATISAVQQKAISSVDIEAQLKQAQEAEAAKLGPMDPFAPPSALQSLVSGNLMKLNGRIRP